MPSATKALLGVGTREDEERVQWLDDELARYAMRRSAYKVRHRQSGVDSCLTI